jgi:hypothetical protein
LSDEDAVMWFWYEKVMSENDEDPEDGRDDVVDFSERCSRCGSKLRWSKEENRFVCLKCSTLRRMW